MEDIINATIEHINAVKQAIKKCVEALGYFREADSQVTQVNEIPKPPKVIGRPLQGYGRVMFVRKLC